MRISANGSKIRGSDRKHAQDAEERYASAHWGLESTAVTTFDGYEDLEPHICEAVTEMGKLVGFEILPDIDSDKIVEIGIPHSPPTVLAFTPDTERLMIFSPPKAAQQLARELIVPGATTYDLAATHKRIGGRQSQFSFPRVAVQVIGCIHAILYRTNKKGDGLSNYRHEFGDLSEGDGTKPWLAIDGFGRLFLMGGDYRVPDEGITG